jgi:hypothetical protein
MKYAVPADNTSAFWAWMLGILCLVPFVYIPPIGANILLYLLNPLFAIPAVIFGVIGLKKSAEKGGGLHAWIGIGSGAMLLLVYLLLFLIMPGTIFAGKRPAYDNVFLTGFNSVLSLLFAGGPIAGGILAADALIRGLRSVLLRGWQGRKYMAWTAVVAGALVLLMSLWYSWLWIDEMINPHTLG